MIPQQPIKKQQVHVSAGTWAKEMGTQAGQFQALPRTLSPYVAFS